MSINERIHRHHLLEIILWPNDDGTFKTILNSAERLQQLGIYDDWKLTIQITCSEHSSLHNRYLRDDTLAKHRSHRHSEESKAKMSNAMKGHTVSADARQRIGEAAKGRNIGRRHSEEARAKMRAAALRRHRRH